MNRAVLEIANGVEELFDFCLAEYYWQSARLLWMRNARDGPVALQSNAVKKAQGTDRLNEFTRGDVAFIDQIYLVLTNLFRPEQLRRLAEMPGKVFDAVDVSSDGVR